MSLGEEVIEGHQKRIGELGTMRTTLQNIANYVMVSRQNILVRQFEGQNRLEATFVEETAAQANNALHRFLMSVITPLDEQWIDIVPSDHEKRNNEAVKSWYKKWTLATLRQVVSSNFYGPWAQFLMELPSFCTASMTVERGDDDLLKFSCVPMGFFTFENDSSGRAVKLSYEVEYTASQAVDRFGPQKASMEADLMRKGDKDSILKKRKYVHEVRKNTDTKSGSADSKDLPWQSIWARQEDHAEMEVTGFSNQPFIVTVWDQTQHETWGWGPGREYLGIFRRLTEMERTLINGFNKVVDPPILAPHGSAMDFDIRSSGVTLYDPAAGGLNAFKPETWMDNSSPERGLDFQESVRARVRKIFYNDLAETISSLPDKDRTFGEIRQRVREKVRLFSPTYIRITKGLEVLMRTAAMIVLEESLDDTPGSPNFIPPPPEGAIDIDPVTGKPSLDIDIQFVNRLAIELKEIQNEAFDRVMEKTALLSQIPWDQPPFDNWDPDKIVRDLHNDEGANPDWLTDVNIRDRARDERAAQQAAIQGTETLAMASEGVKNLGPQAQQAVTSALQSQIQQ